MNSQLIQVSIHLVSYCFFFPHGSCYPFREGKVCNESLPVYNLSPINLTESGTVTKVTGWAFIGGDKPIRMSLLMHTFQGFYVRLNSFNTILKPH